MEQQQDPRIEALLNAAYRGDLGVVVDILDSGLDVNVVTPNGVTALREATQGCHIDLMRLLLERGARLDVRDRLGYSALTLALLRSRGETGIAWGTVEPDRRPLDLLLAAGARYGILEAVVLGDVEMVRARLDEGADPNTGERKYDGPMLSIAAKLGHLEVARLLLDRGARLEATDDLGATALVRAAGAGHLAVVELLLNRGADIDHGDWSDLTPLGDAASSDHAEVVRLLISRGARRGLLDAVALGDAGLVAALLRDGADPDNVYYSHVGRLPGYAVRRGDAEIVQLLIQHGAEQYKESYDERPLLAEAAKHGHLDVAKLLLERGAEPDQVGKDGLSARAWAERQGHSGIVERLDRARPASHDGAASD